MSTAQVEVAVIGATGYAGATAVALLSHHPHVRISRVTSRSYAGRAFNEVYPGLDCDLVLEGTADPGDAEVVIAALPHGMAGGMVAAWLEQGRTVIDLGADFRLNDAAAYERWYGSAHPAPDLLRDAVFGLPEIDHAGRLRGARLVACPGCYSTAAILAVTPALKKALVHPDVIVDAASGVSGAGRSLGLGYHFAEANEDYKAYSVRGHRHMAEMEQAWRDATGGEVRVTFVPHLAPMTRGILATCYLELEDGRSVDDLRGAYEVYSESAFVDIVDTPPGTKEVSGTNRCLIHITTQGDRVIVLAAIDNLVKGAAGQGVQALNLVEGWPETAGLELPARWP
jgi:N-acetyl-gamma-glutamyl-phosphate reductase